MRAIDADELKKAFPARDNSKPVLVARVRAVINHMPTIEPERQNGRKGKWELIYKQPKSDAWACNVTAKCSCCGEPLVTLGNRLGWGNDRDTGETIVWSGFITNWKDNRERARLFALNCAESVSSDLFPNFCENCGAKMIGN